MELERMGLAVHQMAEHYDVVVVGSGYGGGITASRLARAGARVCVLERGKELHPGEYPSAGAGALAHIQATVAARRRKGRIGSPTALIDFDFSGDIGVVRGCGLGGTSLINANVARRADPKVFDDERWPAELRGNGFQVLLPYYVKAEEMLGSAMPPAALLDLPKTLALARTADAMGGTFSQAPLNVTFTDGPNAAGVMQRACTLCGDCVSGCNHSAKNTVLMNYIPDAHQHGAHIFCEVSVRTVLRDPIGDGRWVVSFCDMNQRRFGDATRTVTSDIVVLAAGSIGSTEILLRSRAAGLQTSDRLGLSFTGNGDVLAFAFDADTELRGVGQGKRPVGDDNAVGPCIAGMIDVPDAQVGDFLVQEGSVPASVGWVSGLVWALSALFFGDDGTRGWKRLFKRLSQFVRSLFGPNTGPPARSMNYLVMSLDDDNGQLVLADDKIDIRWPNIAERPVFRVINDRLADGAKALGGAFVPSPAWASPFGSTLLTVQPLGGCDMGDDASHGVVNHKGQVFRSGPGPGDVYDSLYVADGAVIPRPLGANPSLTISAVAERIAEFLVADHGFERDPHPVTRPAPGPGLTFSEKLYGHFSTKVQQGYGAGEAQGKADGSRIEFVLTVAYDTLDVLTDGTARAHCYGTATAPVLGPGEFRVDGDYRMWVPDTRRVETRHMRYELTLRGGDGSTFVVRLFKLLRERGSLEGWHDTTTAYATVCDAAGTQLGKGLVHITPIDFAKLGMSLTVPGVTSPLERWKVRLRFGKVFVQRLLSLYGGPLDEPGEFAELPVDTERPVGGHRELSVPKPESWWRDRAGTWHEGATLGPHACMQLLRYRGGDNGPVVLSCGFAMSATSFLLDTVDENLVEHLVAQSYDVWLFDNRGGIQLPSVEEPYTLDDVATQDWPLAIDKIREITGAADVQVVAHCTGALTFQMAMLAGMTGVRSAVLSALTAYFRPHPLKRFLNGLGAEKLVAALGIKGFKPYTQPTLRNQIIDIVLRLHPMPREEKCGQAICRWINVVYGCTHRHEQLNDATHEAIHSLFGLGNFSAGRQFGGMFRKGHVLDAAGTDAYLQRPDRLAIPILFLHGDRNTMFDPAGSERTMSWLSRANGRSLYRREVLRGYGHLDAFIGRDAHRDVYPLISGHLSEHLEASR